jgi:molybdopterin-binding protein
VGLTDRTVRLEEGRIVAEGPSAAVLRAGETQVDNYFVGTVVAPGRIRVGDVELAADVRGSGDVRLACYAHDVLLAAEVPRAISARNCIATTVAAVEPAGETVLVTLERPPIRALVTADAARELGLRPGAATVAVVKAMSIAIMGAA